MNDERALIIIEPAQPQVVTVSDVSSDEIEYQRIIQEHRALIKQGRELKERYNAALVRVVQAWFTENYPSIKYHMVPPGLIDDKNVIFGATVIIDTPGYTEAYQELTKYLNQLYG